MSPDPQISMTLDAWKTMLAELHRRTGERHESGAFLLGSVRGNQRIVSKVIFYDDLDHKAYDSGVCVLFADAFSRLWDRCAGTALSVIADVHVHAFGSTQSWSDRTNPMIAQTGHLAIILPNWSKPPVGLQDIGIYQYQGSHRWRSFRGNDVAHVLKLEG